MKQDRRINKTKKAAHSAFITLLGDHSFEEITITDICRIADINRKTFYNHYTGIYQLMEEIENLIVREFEQLLNQYNIDTVLNKPQIFFDALNNVIRDKYEDYFRLVSSNYSTGLVTKIIAALKMRIKEFMVEADLFNVKYVDYIITYTISGLVSLYQSVFDQEGFNTGSDRLSAFSRIIVMEGVRGIMAIEQREQE